MKYEPENEKIQKLCKEHQESEFSALILDQDGQVLSKGKVLLYTHVAGGAFWPDKQDILDDYHRSALFVENENSGERIQIYHIRACRHNEYIHYHFQTEK